MKFNYTLTSKIRIASVLDKVLAIAFGSIMVTALIWSMFGPTKTVRPEIIEKPNAAKRHEDLVLMDAVRAVNADASLLMLSPFFSLALDEPTSCLLARKMKERPDAASLAVGNIVSDHSRECEFSQIARKFTLPIFQKIASAKALPSELFIFHAFHSDAWRSVGPFDQIATCNSVQQEGTKLGIGTKSCTSWTPRL